MSDNNAIKERSYSFALKTIKLYQYIIKNKREFVLSKQLLKSGTSIGANVEEACSGQSRKDFIAKMSIAQKEAFETRYWLRLLRDSGIVENKYTTSMLEECEILIRIVTKIIVTSKKKLK